MTISYGNVRFIPVWCCSGGSMFDRVTQSGKGDGGCPMRAIILHLCAQPVNVRGRYDPYMNQIVSRKVPACSRDSLTRYFFDRNSITFATMFSAVNPNFAATAFAGPDAPKVSIVM